MKESPMVEAWTQWTLVVMFLLKGWDFRRMQDEGGPWTSITPISYWLVCAGERRIVWISLIYQLGERWNLLEVGTYLKSRQIRGEQSGVNWERRRRDWKQTKASIFFYDPLVILGQSCGFLVLKSRRDWEFRNRLRENRGWTGLAIGIREWSLESGE